MNVLHRYLTLALLIFTASTHAAVVTNEKPYYPADFYTSLDAGTLHDQTLKDKLFKILSKVHVPGAQHDAIQDSCNGASGCYQQTVLGYTRARQIMFGEIHLQQTAQGYALFDVYCQVLHTADEFGSKPPGPDLIPEGTVMNTEHTWPQSRFTSGFPKEMQKSDLNILYPVSEKANSSRNNLHYGDVTDVMSQPCSASKRGHSAGGGKDVVFEPPAAHKGNAARAMFYFSVRYKQAIPPDEEASLRAWHHADPPDDFERQRNETVFSKQHERNPFIDHPELVDMISDF